MSYIKYYYQVYLKKTNYIYIILLMIYVEQVLQLEWQSSQISYTKTCEPMVVRVV